MTSIAGPPPSRVVQLAALIVGYLLAMYLCFRPVQLRIWNDFGAVDVLTMAGLILPFMVMPRFARPRLRVTRYAWGASAVMALDLACFAVGSSGREAEATRHWSRWCRTIWHWPSPFSFRSF